MELGPLAVAGGVGGAATSLLEELGPLAFVGSWIGKGGNGGNGLAGGINVFPKSRCTPACAAGDAERSAAGDPHFEVTPDIGMQGTDEAAGLTTDMGIPDAPEGAGLEIDIAVGELLDAIATGGCSGVRHRGDALLLSRVRMPDKTFSLEGLDFGLNEASFGCRTTGTAVLGLLEASSPAELCSGVLDPKSSSS